jgi:hypothetical protein
MNEDIGKVGKDLKRKKRTGWEEVNEERKEEEKSIV